MDAKGYENKMVASGHELKRKEIKKKDNNTIPTAHMGATGILVAKKKDSK